MLSLKCYHNGTGRDITAKAGNLVWGDSEDSLGMDFSFEYAKGIYLGDIIILKKDKEEIFRGLVTSIEASDEYTRQIKGYDFARYLNKSECIIQFKKIAADEAISQLCKKYGVPVDSIPTMSTSIKKIYKDVLVIDVINDILKQVKNETGKKYRVEMRKGKLRILKAGSIKAEPYYINENGEKILSTTTCLISGAQRSIEEMKNEIIVAGTGDSAKQIKATVRSSSSIKKYGLMSQVETADNLTEAKARNIGKNKLKNLNRIKRSFTAEMLGGITLQSSRMVYFDRPEVSIKGWYKVRSCSHQVDGGLHKVTCEMEEP